MENANALPILILMKWSLSITEWTTDKIQNFTRHEMFVRI